MRKSVSLIIVGVALAAMVSSAAVAKTIVVRLTEQQVANVCGKQSSSGGGHTGCTKSCGQYVCDYDCTKKGCGGQCLNCPGTDRKIFPGLKSRAVISNAVVNAN